MVFLLSFKGKVFIFESFFVLGLLLLLLKIHFDDPMFFLVVLCGLFLLLPLLLVAFIALPLWGVLLFFEFGEKSVRFLLYLLFLMLLPCLVTGCFSQGRIWS